MSPGATPKLTKSARLSSSAPKREVPRSRRATRPSMPSSTAASTIAPSAISSRPSTANGMAVNPAQSASRVITFGTSVRTGMVRKRPRRRRRSGPSGRLGSMGGKKAEGMRENIESWDRARHRHGPHGAQAECGGSVSPDCGATRLQPGYASTYSERTTAVGGAQVGEHRLAGDRGLPFGDHRAHAFGQIDVEARAEADHAEALARPDGDALAHERDDAAGDEAGDLHHHDADAARGGDDERVPLIVLARLVEIGIDELAGTVGDALDLPAHRAAVHVAIEHAHEDRHAGERLRAEAELGRQIGRA